MTPNKEEEDTISEINKKGTKTQKNEHVEMSAQHAEAVWKKRLSSDKWEETSLDQDVENACNCGMDYDKVWVNRGHTENMKKVNTIMTKTHWSGVKIDDGFLRSWKELCWNFGHC